MTAPVLEITCVPCKHCSRQGIAARVSLRDWLCQHCRELRRRGLLR